MPILWSEEYLTDVRIIPILTQRDIGVDRTLALLIWLIENVDFAFVFSPCQCTSKLSLVFWLIEIVVHLASFRHNAKKPHQYKPHKQTSDK